jgi:hypothetical protein
MHIPFNLFASLQSVLLGDIPVHKQADMQLYVAAYVTVCKE